MGEIKAGTTFRFGCFLSAALLLGASCFADDVPELVGEYGNPAHLVFKGDSPFTSTQLRDAVESDLEVQVAASLADSLPQYQQILKARLINGFQRAGFDQPSIDIRAEPTTHDVIVTMNPGKRWISGPVVFDGDKDAPTEALIRSLTRVQPPSMFETSFTDGKIGDTCDPGPDPSNLSDPEWEAGKPAPFDTTRANRYTDYVRARLADLGYFHPFLRVSIDPGEKDATLTIHLIDLGHKAVLRRIECEGLERNTKKSLEEFLGIKPGEDVTLLRIHEMQRKLWESGRFVQHSITVQDIPGDGSRVVLQLSLKEAETVPLLTEPLTETDQAMVKLSQWCAASGANGNDWVANLSDGGSLPFDLQLAWGGRRGFAVTAKLIPGKSSMATMLGDAGNLGLSLTPARLGIFLPVAGMRFEGPLDARMYVVNTIVHPSTNPTADKLWDLNFSSNFNYRPVGDGKADLLRVHQWFPPAAFLAIGRSKDSYSEIKASVLTLKTADASMTVDTKTGQPIAGQWVKDDWKLHWSVRPHAVEELQKTLLVQNPVNTWAADRSLVSLAGFVLQAASRTNLLGSESTLEQRKNAADALAKVLDPADLGPLEQTMMKAWSTAASDGDFYLPSHPGSPGWGSALGVPACCGMMLSDRLFKWRSWPSVVGRCLSLNLIGRGELMVPEFRECYSPSRAGPLQCLVMSVCVRNFAMNDSCFYARAGLAISSPDKFGQDCQALLNGSPEIDATARQIGSNLRVLSKTEVSAIADLLPTHGASAFRAAVGELQKYQGQVTQKQLEVACEAAWNAGLRALVEDQLDRLTVAPKAEPEP